MNKGPTLRCGGCGGDFPRAEFWTEDGLSQRCERCRAGGGPVAEALRRERPAARIAYGPNLFPPSVRLDNVRPADRDAARRAMEMYLAAGGRIDHAGGR